MFFLDKIFVAGLFLDKIFVAGLLSNQVTVQIKHLCSVPHSLLSHLPVQGRAHLPRAPLSPPTPDVQEGCCLLLILFFFVMWDQQLVSGQCISNVITHYLVAHYV